MLYFLLIKKKVNLPFVLFRYMKEAIRKTRNAANIKKKVSTHVPCGRLLTSNFVESGLIDFLTKEATFTEYLIPNIGELFTG